MLRWFDRRTSGRAQQVEARPEVSNWFWSKAPRDQNSVQMIDQKRRRNKVDVIITPLPLVPQHPMVGNPQKTEVLHNSLEEMLPVQPVTQVKPSSQAAVKLAYQPVTQVKPSSQPAVKPAYQPVQLVPISFLAKGPTTSTSPDIESLSLAINNRIQAIIRERIPQVTMRIDFKSILEM